MKVLTTIKNYFCYCGIEKDEYNAVKRDAYVSNFKIWRILHFLMAAVFGLLFVSSLLIDMMEVNRTFYLATFLYALVAVCLFLRLKEDSLIAQFLIYLTIVVLFVFSCLITQNKPDIPATTFIVLLLVTPMFMIDKPYFMTIVLIASSTVFLIWMHGVKPSDIWLYDVVNVIIFTIVGIFLHVIANSIRIKEFVLTREINIQKDTDELTGLKNKGALTREINEYLLDESTSKGMMLLLDIDKFKSINDTYGHDVGDVVIREFGRFLGGKFTADEVVGHFGGDEFIVFIKGEDDPDVAREIAQGIITGASELNVLPEGGGQIWVSVGVGICSGQEKNYSELFKRADTAMYKAKADPKRRFYVN